MGRKKTQRPKMSELLGHKHFRFFGDHVINDKIFYRLEVDAHLMPGFPVVAMYFSGNDYCCDPRAMILPDTEPIYSIYDALQMRAVFLNGLGSRISAGFAFVGSDPCQRSLSKLLFYIRLPNLSMYTDGSNLTMNSWPNRFRDVNLIIKHSSEVDYLPTYYETMVNRMDKLGSMKTKRLIARYNKETKDEILETANLLQGIRNDWEIVEFDCDKLYCENKNIC